MSATTVTVSILDKDYQVSCSPEEVAELKRSAEYLNEKMREIKASGSVLGLDRIAVMAALNIANDMLTASHSVKTLESEKDAELQQLNGKIDQALARFRVS